MHLHPVKNTMKFSPLHLTRENVSINTFITSIKILVVFTAKEKISSMYISSIYLCKLFGSQHVTMC